MRTGRAHSALGCQVIAGLRREVLDLTREVRSLHDERQRTLQRDLRAHGSGEPATAREAWLERENAALRDEADLLRRELDHVRAELRRLGVGDAGDADGDFQVQYVANKGDETPSSPARAKQPQRPHPFAREAAAAARVRAGLPLSPSPAPRVGATGCHTSGPQQSQQSHAAASGLRRGSEVLAGAGLSCAVRGSVADAAACAIQRLVRRRRRRARWRALAALGADTAEGRGARQRHRITREIVVSVDGVRAHVCGAACGSEQSGVCVARAHVQTSPLTACR